MSLRMDVRQYAKGWRKPLFVSRKGRVWGEIFYDDRQIYLSINLFNNLIHTMVHEYLHGLHQTWPEKKVAKAAWRLFKRLTRAEKEWYLKQFCKQVQFRKVWRRFDND